MADWTTGIRDVNEGVGRWARSNLFSNFVPGLFDYQNMFKSMMSAPMTKQPGGGVGSMRARNDQTMSQYLPGQAPLVAGAADEKNIFADLMSQKASSNWRLLSMLDELKAARTRMDTAGGGGLFGLLGI
jgi:hypothetical protein